MTFEQIRALHAIVVEGSFRAAAEKKSSGDDQVVAGLMALVIDIRATARTNEHRLFAMTPWRRPIVRQET